jgi:hypothetical protein
LISAWQHTRGFRSGAAIGALVLTCAGAAWAIAALANRPGVPAWTYAAAAVPVLALLSSGVRCLLMIRRDDGLRPPGLDVIEGAQRGRRVGVLFGAVFAAEIALIAVAAIVLSHAGRPLLIPVAVVAIVGVHFVPLARLFHIPVYGAAGWLLLTASLVSLLIVDERLRVFILGLAAAVVLWASAAVVLALHTGGGRAQRHSRRNLEHQWR